MRRNKMIIPRNLPVGAELLASGEAHFRVWAPHLKKITLVLETGIVDDPRLQPQAQIQQQRLQKIAELAHATFTEFDMEPDGAGYMTCLVENGKGNMRYRFKLDNSNYLYPDPVSRFQPEGPHGPSLLIDFSAFPWTDKTWRGIQPNNRVIYEMHVGTFTQEGTLRAAVKELPELANIGITIIELMPVAEFDGKFGWGYDGVAFFSPYHYYGTPDDLRHFVDAAHAVGVGVILDVVYNHCGASGAYLRKFSDDYFTTAYDCEWGDVFNFDQENCAPVREFFVSNAIYWVTEFHIDGFRLDATQQIYDASSEHIITAIVRETRKRAGARNLYIIGENEPQNTMAVRAHEDHGWGLDGIWNDDFHHSATVALKGHTEAYFTDYKGEPQEFISAVKYGFLFQGQWYRWQKKRRGTPTFGLPPQLFIHFLQNHDQIANSGIGKRVHQISSAGLYRALTALLLLAPATPLLFQGQEFAASAPFLYFADHNAELAKQVRKGRNEFLHQFPSLAAPETQPYLPHPDDPQTFTRSKLDFSERALHHEVYNLHKDLLQLRREDPVFSQSDLTGIDGAVIDGAVLSPMAFVLRFFSAGNKNDRLLLINLGCDVQLSPMPEPLLAPPECDWQLLWSSEHPRYGSQGSDWNCAQDRWRLPGLAAIVLMPAEKGDEHDV